jgi:hypothetical protein
MICASMPTMRLILARFLPKLFVSTKADSQAYNSDRNRVYSSTHNGKGPVTAEDIELAAIDSESAKDARSVDYQSLKDVRSIDCQSLKDVRSIDCQSLKEIRPGV